MEMFVSFAELAEEEGKPFEFLRTGTFTDMNGRKVEITDELLDRIVASFEQGAAGQEVPIDVDHKRNEAAGWIARLQREGDRLIAYPEWNALGRQLVGDKIYRYVSATLDLGRSVLKSISLTNFPAVKDLKPVELAEEIAAIASGFNAPVAGDESAAANTGTGKEAGKANEVVVVMLGGIVMPKQEAVKNTKVEEPQAPIDAKVVEQPEVEKPAEKPAAELSEKPADKAADKVADKAVETKEQEVNSINFAQLLAEARTQMAAEFQAMLASELKKARDESAAIVQNELTKMRQEQEILAFSERITSTGKHAIPVEPSVITDVLNGLPPAKQQAVRNLLETITVHGTVDFSEVGTSAGDTKPVKPKLGDKEREVVVEFMQAGMTLPEIFNDAADLLGSMEQWDLSEFGA